MPNVFTTILSMKGALDTLPFKLKQKADEQIQPLYRICLSQDISVPNAGCKAILK